MSSQPTVHPPKLPTSTIAQAPCIKSFFNPTTAASPKRPHLSSQLSKTEFQLPNPVSESQRPQICTDLLEGESDHILPTVTLTYQTPHPVRRGNIHSLTIVVHARRSPHHAQRGSDRTLAAATLTSQTPHHSQPKYRNQVLSDNMSRRLSERRCLNTHR